MPASNIQRLVAWGVEVTYGVGSLNELSAELAEGSAPIVFVRTCELSYWNEDTPYAIVVVGIDESSVYLLDPAYSEKVPVGVPSDEFSLAWSYFDQTYALISGSK
ncbi:MAG: hypothetical protein GY759_02115 [Chloroflexi bacterium]|nr:hypothetical protein [Chloroflexota bacterium]